MRFASLLLLCALLTLPAPAQLIPIKTIPVAEGNQFLTTPSRAQAMGGLHMTIQDPLSDPFQNPAWGTAVQGLRFMSAPVYYGITENTGWGFGNGSGRTMPLGVLAQKDGYFAGAMATLQTLTVNESNFWGCATCDFLLLADDVQQDLWPTPVSNDGDRYFTNTYLFGLLGRHLPNTNWSVGLSVFHARLGALEGVRLLYAQGSDVEQDGDMQVYRLGAVYQSPTGRTAEIAVAHHRFSMQHTLADWTWISWDEPWQYTQRIERDETNGWAASATVREPLGTDWHLGLHVGGDLKHHPKIPNYDLMAIPRDPGNSAAFNVGFGLARTHQAATLGLEVTYEPIWSHTWADALEATPRAGGGVIPVGSKTVDNRFRFHNLHLRLGLDRQFKAFDFQLGFHLHNINYRLDQRDLVGRTERTQHENWHEWTVSGGLGYRFPEFEVRYLGQLTLGTGQPGTNSSDVFLAEGDLGADFVVAPNGPLLLREARVVTHQIALIVPIDL